MNRPTLERLGVLPITGAGSTGRIWDFAESSSGDYLYAAASGDGIYTFNITDPENPTLEGITPFYESSGPLTEFSGECTDIIVDGNDLFVCGRAINFNNPNQGDGNNPAPGILSKYDISGANESAPSYTSTYTFPDRLFYIVAGMGNVWPQGIVSDGTHIFAACQYDGLYVINQSTMAFVARLGWDELPTEYTGTLYTGTVTAANDVFMIDNTATFPGSGGLNGNCLVNLTKRFVVPLITADLGTIAVGGAYAQPSTDYLYDDLVTNGPAANLWEVGDSYAIFDEGSFYWECSRSDKKDDYVYLANHGKGVWLVDVSSASTPTGVTVINTPPIDYENNGVAVQLRPRNVLIVGDYLLAVPNTTTGNDEPNRGLMVAEIPADPTTMDSSFWQNYEIGVGDNTAWPGNGDRQLQGLSVCRNFAYVANGLNGPAIFDIADPTPRNVIYQGSPAKGTTGTANLYTTFAFERGGEVYCYYGDAFQTAALQEHNLYYDKVHEQGLKGFKIGEDLNAGNGVLFVNLSSALSSDLHAVGEDTHVGVRGDSIHTLGCVVERAAGARTYSVQLHTVLNFGNDGTVTPGDPVGPVVTFAVDAGSGEVYLAQAITPFPLVEGVRYCACLSQTVGGGNGRVVRTTMATYFSSQDTTLTNGVFNTPWVKNANISNVRTHVFAYGSNAAGRSSGISALIGRRVTDSITGRIAS